jgi:DNA-directed RNA polymerase subunit M/transcription elongation factor TFIIS
MTTEFYIPEKNRQKCISEFEKYLPKKKCKNVENGIYDYTRDFCSSNNLLISEAEKIYSSVENNLLFNFKNEKNVTIKKIIKRIEDGEKNLDYNLVFMPPHELDEENWKDIIEKIDNTEKTLKNLPTIEWNKCKSCGNTRYTYYQLQVRRSDEPITTFYICSSCGKNYKVNR